MDELLQKINFDRDGASQVDGAQCLGYTPVRIFNPFLASRLNNLAFVYPIERRINVEIV